MSSPSRRCARRPGLSRRHGSASPPRGPGSLLREGNRVLVEVRFESGARIDLAALRAAGAEIVDVDRRYRTVTVAVRAADLPRARRGGWGRRRDRDAGARWSGAPTAAALARSEGDAQLGAAGARAAFGLDGSGVTVGILSDSFDRDPEALSTAAGRRRQRRPARARQPLRLDRPVRVLDDGEADGGDEGRAMAQIVHDLAPGAAIDFATAFTGEIAFAANIGALADAGAGVIVDDVAYFQEPFFQDGPVAVAVDEAAAAGVSYFSAAGNDNLIDEDGRDIASWEAPAFRDSGNCPAALVALSEEVEAAEEDEGSLSPRACDPATAWTSIPKRDRTTRPLGSPSKRARNWRWTCSGRSRGTGSRTDLDAFLLDEDGELVEVDGDPVAAVEDNVEGSQRPFEFLAWENEGPTREVRLVDQPLQRRRPPAQVRPAGERPRA